MTKVFVDSQEYPSVISLLRDGNHLTPAQFRSIYHLYYFFPEKRDRLQLREGQINSLIRRYAGRLDIDDPFEQIMFFHVGATLILLNPESKVRIPVNEFYQETVDKVKDWKSRGLNLTYIDNIANIAVCYGDNLETLTKLTSKEDDILIDHINLLSQKDAVNPIVIVKITNPEILTKELIDRAIDLKSKNFYSILEFCKAPVPMRPGNRHFLDLVSVAFELLILQASKITLDEKGWHLSFEKPETHEKPLPERRKY